jgi:hypothetical protein
MAMTEEVRRRLRAASAARRGLLLKDVSPAELVRFTDMVKEEMSAAWDPLEVLREGDVRPHRVLDQKDECYVRRATPAQVEALAQGLPHRYTRCVFHAGGGTTEEREVVVFRAAAVRRLFGLMGVKKPDNYYGPMAGRTEVRTDVGGTRMNRLEVIGGADRDRLGAALADWPGWQTWRGYGLWPERDLSPERVFGRYGCVVAARRYPEGSARPFYAARPFDVPAWVRVDVANLSNRLAAMTTTAGWGQVDEAVKHYFNPVSWVVG